MDGGGILGELKFQIQQHKKHNISLIWKVWWGNGRSNAHNTSVLAKLHNLIHAASQCMLRGSSPTLFILCHNVIYLICYKFCPLSGFLDIFLLILEGILSKFGQVDGEILVESWKFGFSNLINIKLAFSQN